MSNKKLWIVFCDSDEDGDRRFIASFSTQEQADKNARRLNKAYPHYFYYVEECELDKDYQVAGMNKYKVTIIIESDQDPSDLLAEFEEAATGSDLYHLDPEMEEEGTAITVEDTD